jgi:nitrite reductase/ring-hydroxylating ferredoxin subunit
MALILLCRADDPTPDRPVRAEAAGRSYAVFKAGNRICVTQDECTHGPGFLSEGYVDGEEIECPFHQGRFNILTGVPTAPPCTVALKTWEPVIEDGGVWIDADMPRQP